jgi:hypothetical protein
LREATSPAKEKTKGVIEGGKEDTKSGYESLKERVKG